MGIFEKIVLQLYDGVLRVPYHIPHTTPQQSETTMDTKHVYSPMFTQQIRFSFQLLLLYSDVVP